MSVQNVSRGAFAVLMVLEAAFNWYSHYIAKNHVVFLFSADDIFTRSRVTMSNAKFLKLV